MIEGELSLVNKAIYYWDYYLLTQETDYLISAHSFMKSYRESGGELYQETERVMESILKTKLQEGK